MNINNSKWSYTHQLGLKEKQKLQKECQVVQQKWNKKMKPNLKKLAVIFLTIQHFTDNQEVQIQLYSDPNR
jgi:hypothetical protein